MSLGVQVKFGFRSIARLAVLYAFLSPALLHAAPASTSAPAPAASAAADTSPLVKPDPDTVIGFLPNGVRYAIKQHPSHQKEVIYLHIAAGSLDETDSERGLAHFLEHMAFNGSRNFPAASLMKTFETAGIGFGRDQNAFTNYFDTTYVLNIPNENSDKLDLGFRWLRDVADGLLLAPDEVKRERGVVLSEYTVGLGPARTLYEDRQRFISPGLRPTDRLPIGLKAVIEGAEAPAVRAYYERWYRPENATVVAVGDEPVAAMKARIVAAFGAWKSATPEPKRFDIGAVDFKRPSAAIGLSDPHIPTAVGVCRFSPKAPHRLEDVSVTRERLADQIWSQVFAERMARRARDDNPPFLAAGGSYSVAYRTVADTCFSASAKLDDWRTALDALSAEIRRLEIFGITKKEFEDAKTRILTNADAAVASAATQTPELLANSLLNNLVEDDTFDTFEEDRRVTRLALEGLDPAAVAAAFRKHWTEAAAPLITVSGPAPIADNEIMAAWSTSLAGPPPSPPGDHANAAWAYGDSGAAGKVVAREEIKDPVFTRLTFQNGVVVNFKQTDFSKNGVSIGIVFGAGQQELPPGDAFDATVGAGALYRGGLKRNDVDDLTEVCKGHACSAGLQVNRDNFDLYGSTRSNDLGLELQILRAFLAEPGFRPIMASAMPTVAASTFRAIRSSPAALAALKLDESLPKPHPLDLPPEAHVAGLKATDFAALLQGPLTQDPLEVTIVGDVDEATATDLVAKTLGTLPTRTPGDRTRPDAVRVVLSTTPPPPMTAFHEGPKDQAVVQLAWPLFVWSPAKTHQTRVIALLTRTLQDAVTERIRQKLGKSYSPSVGASLPRGGDQGSLTMLIQTSPDAVAAVDEEALKIAADFAAGGITAEALEQARKPLLDAAAKRRTYNAWWLGVMNGSHRYPDQLAAAQGWDADMASITLAEVKAEAARWLAQTPYRVRALPKAQTAEAGAPDAKGSR